MQRDVPKSYNRVTAAVSNVVDFKMNLCSYMTSACAHFDSSRLHTVLWAYYNCDTSTIRARFGYNTLQHATRFFVRSHTR